MPILGLKVPLQAINRKIQYMPIKNAFFCSSIGLIWYFKRNHWDTNYCIIDIHIHGKRNTLFQYIRQDIGMVQQSTRECSPHHLKHCRVLRRIFLEQSFLRSCVLRYQQYLECLGWHLYCVNTLVDKCNGNPQSMFKITKLTFSSAS